MAHLLAKLARVEALVVDDFALAPMSELERRDFLDICDDRYRLPGEARGQRVGRNDCASLLPRWRRFTCTSFWNFHGRPTRRARRAITGSSAVSRPSQTP